MKIVAIRLKEARMKNGLTQKEFADELGIPLKTYKNYETIGIGHATPSFEVLIKMSELLGVTLDYLGGK